MVIRCLQSDRGQTIMYGLLAFCLAGCLQNTNKRTEERRVGREDNIESDSPGVSSSELLFEEDIEKFRTGRSLDDILNDVQWRGLLIMACEHDRTKYSALTYGLLSKDYSKGLERDRNAEKDGVHAIFVDGKFLKFVNFVPAEMEAVDYKGTKWNRPRPIRVGDCGWLLKAVQGEPINVADVQKQVKLRPPTRSHIDVGFTIAALGLLKTKGPVRVIPEDVYKRNAQLRNQFNASRLKIGMTESEVEETFRAKPLESGKVEAGSFQIYGSNESFNIHRNLHFSNVLVLFSQGRAIAIYSVPSGDQWRDELAQRFIDLPSRSGPANTTGNVPEK